LLPGGANQFPGGFNSRCGPPPFHGAHGTSVKGQVSLTELGRELVYSGSPDEELKAKRTAFLKVDIFRDVFEHYQGSKLPEMQYLGNTLQSKFKLPAAFHEEFSNLFKQNCEYVKLDSGTKPSLKALKQEISGRQFPKSSCWVNRKPKLDSFVS
jgi:hypothetical protein